MPVWGWCDGIGKGGVPPPAAAAQLDQLPGIPQGTTQGAHVGATAAIPFLKYMDMAYRAYLVASMAHPMMMWVADTITILARGEGRLI